MTALQDSEFCFFYLLLGINVVRPEKGKVTAPCLFLMRLGTRLFPTSPKLTALPIRGTSQMPTPCQRPWGDEERFKKGLSLGMRWGGALSKSQPGPRSGAACHGTGDPAGTGSGSRRTRAANPPSLTFRCSGCCGLVLLGLERAFSLRVVLEFACFVALETEECGMLSP